MVWQPPGGCWSAGDDSGSNAEEGVNPFDLAEPTTSEEEGAAGAGDTTDDAGGASATVSSCCFHATSPSHSTCPCLSLMGPCWATQADGITLSHIAGSSSGDEAMGDDFASADLWAARIEAAERGDAGVCFLHNLGQA